MWRLIKTCKRHSRVLATEITFHHIQKTNDNSYWLFVGGTFVMLTSGSDYKHTSSEDGCLLSPEDVHLVFERLGFLSQAGQILVSLLQVDHLSLQDL